MNKVTHLAIRTDDIERTREFYQRLFSFTHTGTHRVRDHMACHLTDGSLDITITKYDEEGWARGADTSSGPFDHLGIEVENTGEFLPVLEELRAPVIERTASGRIRFRDPNGLVVELIPAQRNKESIG